MMVVGWTSSEISSEQINNEIESKILSTEEKLIKTSSKKPRYQLIDYHSLPAFLKDNEFILNYYRSEWPLKQVLLSIFYIHNETLNIWTHLIGFFIFLFLTIYTAMKAPKIMNASFQQLLNMLNSSDLQNFQITRWPFFAFMGGAMFCLLSSCMCHLLSCHSQRLSYIMLRLDYAGIAALISTSFYPPVYYSFICNPLLSHLYLTIITVLGFTTIIFSLLPVFDKPQMRSFRASLFFGMGVSGVAPIIHKLILYRNIPEAIETTVYEILMGLFYGIGAMIYAMRIPERWKPGRFDIAGQSHQVFHILVVAGAYTHYHTGLIYLQWRDAKGC